MPKYKWIKSDVSRIMEEAYLLDMNVDQAEIDLSNLVPVEDEDELVSYLETLTSIKTGIWHTLKLHGEPIAVVGKIPEGGYEDRWGGWAWWVAKSYFAMYESSSGKRYANTTKYETTLKNLAKFVSVAHKKISTEIGMPQA